MKTVTLELSPSGCRKAVKELDKYSDIKKKLDEVCRRLAEIGKQEAELWAQFGNPYGNTDVHASTVPMDNGWKVVLSGADIYFVEFGTGWFAGEYPRDVEVSVGIMPGDYSDTHSQQYSQHGYWFYDNVFYRGTPAEMPMYHAGQRMRQEMDKVAKEVFSKK